MRFHIATSIVAVTLFASMAGAADEVTLYQVTYPEDRKIDLEFSRDAKAPQARLEADVEFRQGQAAIDIKYRDMKPAILFRGDVTCYVLWAVQRGGIAENLGELWVREPNDSMEFSTGLKAFAMIVTGESNPLVTQPSGLVLFTASASNDKRAPSETFTYSGLSPAPATEYPAIAAVEWNRKENLDLQQAESVYRLAVGAGAEEYAPSVLRRARTTLAQATNLSRSGRTSDEAVDYARRTVALSGEALQITGQKKEAERLAAEIAERQAEMAALEARAAEAESTAAEAQVALDATRQERTLAEAAVAAASAELASIRAERERLEQSVARLGEEKRDLSVRLQGALAEVADTRETARGTIVNLPDILFDLNEATLKDQARVVLAKLAGILLIMEELNLRVEGHTDSTGSLEYNQRLSERRAASVRDFLAQQGVDMDRMVAVGYGMDRPVATNETKDGRAQNRRVEIVIAEGTIQEAPAPVR